MSVDYRNFKTPYFEIEIGDSTGKKLVNLPHHILRLVTKVEIFESGLNIDEGLITISFVEGSREPALVDSQAGTEGLYNIPMTGNSTDMQISGSISNRVGSVLDLRFSGDNGITFLTETERKQGKVDNRVQVSVQGKQVTRKHKVEQSRPTFLFQERNQVKVTWGYKEDLSTRRSIRGYILTLNQTFPEDGNPTTTITCRTTKGPANQIAPSTPVTFGRRIKTGKGNSIVTFEDLHTDKLIREICAKAGIPCIVSQNLPAPIVDKDKQKIWLAGQSFTEFMTELARRHNCHFEFIPDPKTGVDTIVFIKRTDFESKLVLQDPNLLTYKAPGSILKSVKINADFTAFPGNQQGTVTKTAEVSSHNVDNPEVQVRQFEDSTGKSEEFTALDPIQSNPVQGLKSVINNVAGGKYTGTFDNNPSEAQVASPDVAQIRTDETWRNIQVDFDTIGYTKIIPGVIELKNIGVRYSGKYRIISVNHIIDSSGYVTQVKASSMSLPSGGVKIQETEKTTTPPEQVDTQLFKPARENTDKTQSASVRDQYEKLKRGL